MDALLFAAMSNQVNGQVYNLGGKEVISLHMLAELLVALDSTATYTTKSYPADRKRIDIGDYYSRFDAFTAATGSILSFHYMQG